MRNLLIVTLTAFALTSVTSVSMPTNAVAEESCTGPNCPQPQSGGHECEHAKKEDTVS